MTMWSALYEQHRGIRRVSRDFATSIRQRLIALAERRHCAKTIQSRFTRRDRGALREWYIQPLEQSDEREPLLGLPSLQDARLTVLALLSRKDDHVHQFTAMIEGKTPRGLPWAAAVHLEDDRESPNRIARAAGRVDMQPFTVTSDRRSITNPRCVYRCRPSRLPTPSIGCFRS